MVDEDSIGVGSILGGFKIERELGRGGMGVVYKGHELSLNRKVALKVLSQALCRDEEFIKRFKREAQVIAALNHPNIVNILSYGEEQGSYYFAMEYIAGKDLGQILKENRSIPLDEALSIAAQVASALDEAGPRGVVHRDLKPSNIMIDDVGRAKVTDFGVAHFEGSDAKLTRTGLFLGTPEYASPEQATGRTLDVRSDIYALGAVLYRMLSGKPPITGESPLAVVTKIATEPVTPIGQINTALPKPVCDLIDKMMAKDPDERFQTPKDVLVAIDHCVDGLKMDAPLAKSKAVDSRMAPPPPPQRKSSAKFWGGIAGVALAVLLVVWLVEGGFLKDKPLTEQRVVDGTPAESADVKTVAGEAAPSPAAPALVAEGIKAARPLVGEKTGDKSAALTTSPILPKVPTVLVVVWGDEAMASLVRGHLESIIGRSGLRVASISEIPILRKKVQFGDMPITWHSIKEFVPKDRAHILLLAQVQKAGSMDLKYYGRTQEMITGTFSARAVDMATGISVATPASSSVKFTQLNMEENLRRTVTSAASGIGAEIKGYWEERIRSPRKTG